MPCIVIVTGEEPRRPKPLTQEELDYKSQTAELVAPCPDCSGSGLVAFESQSEIRVTLVPPGTAEMYVLKFSGDDPKNAEYNATAWILAEQDWLNQKGKRVLTLRYEEAIPRK